MDASVGTMESWYCGMNGAVLSVERAVRPCSYSTDTRQNGPIAISSPLEPGRWSPIAWLGDTKSTLRRYRENTLHTMYMDVGRETPGPGRDNYHPVARPGLKDHHRDPET